MIKRISFSELLSKCNMNESSFLSYLQLKAVLTKITSKGSITASDEHLDNTLKKFASGRGLASGIYHLLLLSSSNSITQTQLRWEQELGISLPPNEWDNIWKHSVSLWKCARFRIINLKVLHRAYITPCRLKKMDKSLSDLCWHGCGNVGTLAHSLLFCPAVKILWNSVRDILSTI